MAFFWLRLRTLDQKHKMKNCSAPFFVATALLIFSVIPNLLGQGNCPPGPPGVVSWWPGNNGTLLGNVTYAPGEVGEALAFNTNESGMAIAAASNLQLQTFSIGTWLRRFKQEWNNMFGSSEGILLAILLIIAAVLVLFWAVLWILFPVFVYNSLNRIEALLRQVESNTRPKR